MLRRLLWDCITYSLPVSSLVINECLKWPMRIFGSSKKAIPPAALLVYIRLSNQRALSRSSDFARAPPGAARSKTQEKIKIGDRSQCFTVHNSASFLHSRRKGKARSLSLRNCHMCTLFPSQFHLVAMRSLLLLATLIVAAVAQTPP